MIVAEEARLTRAANHKLRQEHHAPHHRSQPRAQKASMRTSMARSAPRRHGGSRRICCPPCQASARAFRARLIAETARARQPRSPPDRFARRACPLHPPIRQVARQRASSAAAGRAYAPALSSSARSWRRGTTLSARPRQARSPAANQKSSPSSPRPASCSPSSTPSFATKNHANRLTSRQSLLPPMENEHSHRGATSYAACAHRPQTSGDHRLRTPPPNAGSFRVRRRYHVRRAAPRHL